MRRIAAPIQALLSIVTREQQDIAAVIREYETYLNQTFPRQKDFHHEEALGSLYLGFDMPEFMSRGTHQFVFRLDNNWVAKTHFEPALSTHGVVLGYSVATSALPRTLKKLGIRHLPHYYIGCSMKNGAATLSPGSEFVITPDLTANGRYEVTDVSQERIADLDNSDEVRSQLTCCVKNLMRFNGRNEAYRIRIGGGHKSAEGNSARKAIERMHLLRTKDGIGRLFLADLDHIQLIVNS